MPKTDQQILELKEALKLLDTAAANAVGNRSDHIRVQASIKLFDELIAEFQQKPAETSKPTKR